MTVTKYSTPDNTTDTSQEYKGKIENNFAVHNFIAGAFAPHAADTPNMTVKVDAGKIFIDGSLVSQSQQTTSTIVAPVTNPRIDRVVIDRITGAVSVLTGTEAASPVAPAITYGKISICQFPLTTSTTSITNSMITDERASMALESSRDPELRRNMSIAASVASNDLTVSVKGFDGNAPSVSNVVSLAFRSATLTSGVYTVVNLSAAASVVLPASGTLGFANSEDGYLYVYALNNAGAVEVALARQAIFDEGILHTTVAIGTGSDSADVLYSTSVRSSVAVKLIGRVRITHGTAQWSASPTEVTTYYAGMKKTGDVIQIARNATGAGASGSTTIPEDNTIPQNTEGNEFITQAITPRISISDLFVEFSGVLSTNNSVGFIVAIFQDSTANALASCYSYANGGLAAYKINMYHKFKSGTVSGTTFKIRAGGGTATTTYFNQNASGVSLFNGTCNSYLQITEIMP